MAHLDPQGRGQVRCDLKPGDVLQLSSRLWRIGGAAGNAYLVNEEGILQSKPRFGGNILDKAPVDVSLFGKQTMVFEQAGADAGLGDVRYLS